MSIASLEILYAFEAAIEAAWGQILRQTGLSVYPEFHDGIKQPPFVDVQLTNITPEGHKRPGRRGREADVWNATLTSRIVTRRGESSERQPEMIGAVRIEALHFAERFTPALLPFHEVIWMRDLGITRGIDRESDVDWSLLSHQLVFAIPETSWPE